jgi:hypothetical protein
MQAARPTLCGRTTQIEVQLLISCNLFKKRFVPLDGGDEVHGFLVTESTIESESVVRNGWIYKPNYVYHETNNFFFVEIGLQRATYSP